MYYREKINKLITQGDGKVVDVFYEIYNFILSLDSKIQPEAFQYLCENVKGVIFDNENKIIIKKHFTSKSLEKYLSKIKTVFLNEIKEFAFSSSKNKVAPEKFYKTVWYIINSSKICKNKHERALATFLFVDSSFIPYKAVGTGLSMEEDAYSSIINSFKTPFLDETETIMQMKFEQKTQKASLIVERLNSLNSFEEQTVFMSLIISMAEDRIKNSLKTTIEKL